MTSRSMSVEDSKTSSNADELDAPVQGPINREPDEKLFPERFVQKESGIRKLFKHFVERLEEKIRINDTSSDEDIDY